MEADQKMDKICEKGKFDHGEYLRNWRRHNKEKRRSANKKYYAQYRQDGANSMARWTKEEIQRIMSESRPTDPVLAKQLGRSLQSIQNKRSRLKKPANP